LACFRGGADVVQHTRHDDVLERDAAGTRREVRCVWPRTDAARPAHDDVQFVVRDQRHEAIPLDAPKVAERVDSSPTMVIAATAPPGEVWPAPTETRPTVSAPSVPKLAAPSAVA
jgi:hypothetical protein